MNIFKTKNVNEIVHGCINLNTDTTFVTIISKNKWLCFTMNYVYNTYKQIGHVWYYDNPTNTPVNETLSNELNRLLFESNQIHNLF